MFLVIHEYLNPKHISSNYCTIIYHTCVELLKFPVDHPLLQHFSRQVLLAGLVVVSLTAHGQFQDQQDCDKGEDGQGHDVRHSPPL